MQSSMLLVVARVTVVLTLALLSALALRRTSASVRRLVLLLGALVSLLVPAVPLLLPGRPVAHVVPAPSGLVEFLGALELDRAPVPGHSAPSIAQPASLPPYPWRTVGWCLWGSGALVVLLRLAAGACGMRRLVRRAVPSQGRVRISKDVASPVVAGFFAPVILLPEESRRWSRALRDAVLLHENSHVERRDGLALCIAELTCAAYWFHPLAWWLRASLGRECELASDEGVVASGVRASDYAEHLLTIARSVHIPAGAMAMAARPSALAHRIEVLLSRDALPSPLTAPRAALACGTAVFTLALATCTTAAPEVKKSSPNAERAADPARDVGSSTAAGGREAKLQSIVEAEARQAHTEWSASRVAIVVVETTTGVVRAMTDDDPGRPFVPGSTLKPFTVALALDAGRIKARDRFDCGSGSRSYSSPIYGTRVLRDPTPSAALTPEGILTVSSNIGASRIFDALGGARLSAGLQRFHLEAPAVIDDGSFEGATIAIGHRFLTTPLTLAAAFNVIANDGVYVPLRRADAAQGPSERVVSQSTARSVRTMLESVVASESGTGTRARIRGIRVAGKTGTSDATEVAASFVGMAPAEKPALVILVTVVTERKDATGATAAAPIFARIGKVALSG